MVYIILGYIKERILGSDGMNLFDAWPEMLPRKYLCKWGDGLWLHFATSMLQWPYLTNNVQILLTITTTAQFWDNMSARGDEAVSYHCWLAFQLLFKAIETKYSKHWPYTVAHPFDCVCSKINKSWFNPWFSFYFSRLYPAPYIEWYMC